MYYLFVILQVMLNWQVELELFYIMLFYDICFQRAFRYLQQAADAGNSNAMAYLGKVCLSQN